MDNELIWTPLITEISPRKIQLTVVDCDQQIFWHRRCFTSFERAEKFSFKASRFIYNYEWLTTYGEGVNWAFFSKFFLLVNEDEIYRHWVISIVESFGNFYLKLYDPWGIEFDLHPLEAKQTTKLAALIECQRYIDTVEFLRHPCPGQLSLFEV